MTNKGHFEIGSNTISVLELIIDSAKYLSDRKHN